MHYITSSEYAGPNQDEHSDDHTYQISTEPGRTNMSHEVRTDGWLGTSNDWAQYAHGEFETEEGARKEIKRLLSDGFREIDDIEDYHRDEGVIAEFRVGRYEEWGRETTGDWTRESISDNVTAETSDEQISRLVEEYESEANEEGGTLWSGLEENMVERRDELRDEAEEDNG